MRISLLVLVTALSLHASSSPSGVKLDPRTPEQRMKARAVIAQYQLTQTAPLETIPEDEEDPLATDDDNASTPSHRPSAKKSTDNAQAAPDREITHRQTDPGRDAHQYGYAPWEASLVVEPLEKVFDMVDPFGSHPRIPGAASKPHTRSSLARKRRKGRWNELVHPVL